MSKPYTKFLFFTGKGGVGKTSLASATAIKIADEGYKVLIISTDPASNLSDVLESTVIDQISQHEKINTLYTININPEIAADEYRGRVINPLKENLSKEQLAKIEEGLSGACTTEIASFDEFSRFITGEGNTEDFHTIIFDTAPTGHTLRLLELPALWDDYLEKNPSGASCIGPSSALKSSKERYKKIIKSLRDPELTTFFLVTRAETSSLKEAARTSIELEELGMKNQQLLINGIFTAYNKTDEIAVKIEKISNEDLAKMPLALKQLEQTKFSLLPYNILGLDKLRSIYNKALQNNFTSLENTETNFISNNLESLINLVDTLEGQSDSGLIMTMGKGGVGKTIIAATIATLLAKRGHEVLLTTTDPAAHIKDFMNQLDELPKTLTIERIDPKVETSVYTEKIIQQKKKNLTPEGINLLVEDLKSPCTEEVAVFHAFSKAIQKSKRQFVVIDTAPTGHTLLLLDTTGSYHKEVLKNTNLNPEKITTPYMTLKDNVVSKILLISLPETTPMREAESLQEDLIRAGIKPYAWVINQCLSSLKNLQDPVLKKRAYAELTIINTIKDKIAERVFGVPYIPEEKLLPALLSQITKEEG